MNAIRRRVLAINLAANRAVEQRLCGGGCVENRGWTDVARAASLAVRRSMAASKELGGTPGVGAPAGGTPTGGTTGVESKRPPDIRNPGVYEERARGNPDTKYEGKRFIAKGGVYEVRNGVLVYAGWAAPGSNWFGGSSTVTGHGGYGAGSVATTNQDMLITVLKKMANEGVNVSIWPGLGIKQPKIPPPQYAKQG